MGLLVAGTKYRGEFEERLKKLMEEIKQNDDIILVRSPLFIFLQVCLFLQVCFDADHLLFLVCMTYCEADAECLL